MERPEKGIRIAPTIQQGGVQTIQQSIYLIHDNPCGINPILTGDIGSTGISILDFVELLDTILNDPDVLQGYYGVLLRINAYASDPSRENHILYIKALVQYSQLCALAMLQLPPIDGYNYHLSVYDVSGAMIWDSYTPNLLLYQDELDGSVSYSTVKLSLTNPYAPNQSVEIFQINEKPYLIPYISLSTGTTTERANAQLLMASQFLKNNYAQAESTVSVASLLIDQANTRVYNKRFFGIGSRQIQAPDTSAANPLLTSRRGFGFYISYLSRLLQNIQDIENRSLFEFIVIRLGIEQFDSP